MVYTCPPKQTRKSRKRRPAAAPDRDEGDRLARRPPLRARRAGRRPSGRSRECDCVLDDPNVSRRHAELRRGPTGDWEIVDLGSTNGVKVNGRRLDAAAPRPGDEVVARYDPLHLRHRAVRRRPPPRPVPPAIFWTPNRSRSRSSSASSPFSTSSCSGSLAAPCASCARPARRRPRRPGFHPIGARRSRRRHRRLPRRRHRRRPAARASASTSSAASSIGRSSEADVRIEDRFASVGPLPRLLPRRQLLRRGHELDQRHVPQRRAASRARPS